MQKALWGLLLGLAIIMPLHAELSYQGEFNPEMSMPEYFDAAYPQPEKSIIYVFYNDVNMTCQNCPETIALIEDVYNRYYQNDYNLFVIDYGNDSEYNFIQTYQLNQPLEVVLVKVDDGAQFGWKKINNLNYQTSDQTSFSDNLQYQINSFLGTPSGEFF